MIIKIGLTGGIGSGKSTVAAKFGQLGIPTFSADKISHQLSQPGEQAYLKIVEAFGKDILRPDQTINRTILGDIVFLDAAKKSCLESILHPMIRQQLHKQAEAKTKAEGAPYCVLDIPLLLNAEERQKVNRILVVKCNTQNRIARIKQRSGWSEAKILRVMKNQIPPEKFYQAADDLIDNDGDVSELAAQVRLLHRQYLSL